LSPAASSQFTVKVTVGPVLVVLLFVDGTPFESTPVMVKV